MLTNAIGYLLVGVALFGMTALIYFAYEKETCHKLQGQEVSEDIKGYCLDHGINI